MATAYSRDYLAQALLMPVLVLLAQAHSTIELARLAWEQPKLLALEERLLPGLEALLLDHHPLSDYKTSSYLATGYGYVG